MGNSSAVSILLIRINYARELTGIGPYITVLADLRGKSVDWDI